MVSNRNGHLRSMGVVVDTNVFDIDEVIEMDSEFLVAEGSLFCTKIFVSIVTEWFCINLLVQSLSFSC
jgi:hypothetical protein